MPHPVPTAGPAPAPAPAPARARALALVALLSVPGPAALAQTPMPAQVPTDDPAALRIELNQIEPVEGACRMMLVAENPGETPIAALTLEAVLFDRDGRIAALTLLDLQDLPAGRMRVRRFDLAGIACDDLGRMLINGRDCRPAAAEVCLREPALSSRIDVDLRQ